MSNQTIIIKLLKTLFNAFCGGNQNQNQGQGQGQHQGQNQNHGNQNYQQNQNYNQNQNQGWQNQQNQAYPPQQGQGQNWAGVAGGHSGQHNQYNNHNNNQHNNHNNNHNNNQHHGQNQHQKPHGGGQSRPHGLPAGGVVGPHAPSYHNQDQVNATNDRYQSLRNQARQAGDEAHRCFAQSQEAYKHGDGGKAHDLSAEGKNHQKRKEDLDDEASAWIFNENNRDSPPGTIDLHGLYVKEAIERTEAAIAEGQKTPHRDLRVIVGKGIHSPGHVAKIKPAVQDLIQKYQISAHIDPHNTGVLIVDLDGSDSRGSSRDAGGLVDQMDREQGGDCVIM